MKRILPMVITLCLLLSGCGLLTPAEPSATPVVPDFTFDAKTYPRIAGGAALLPLAEGLTSVMLGVSREDAGEYLSFGSSGDALNALDGGECTLALLPRPEAGFGDKYEAIDIARDALVFVVNAENPVDSLSLSQLRALFSGETLSWAEFSGDDCEPRLFPGGEGSASRYLLSDLVLGGTEPRQTTAFGADGVEYELSFDGSAGAIGVMSLQEATAMGLAEGYKLLSVDGVAPDAEDYPLTFAYSAVFAADARSSAPERILSLWLRSGGGQAFISAQGYAPVDRGEK